MLRPEKVCPVVRKTRHRIRGAGCAVYFDFTVEIRNMFHYICKDLMNSLRFLPFGIFVEHRLGGLLGTGAPAGNYLIF